MTAVEAPLPLRDGAPMTEQDVETARTCDFSLPTDLVSVPVSRCLATEALAAWGLAGEHPMRETALLVLSELVTNSVRHAARLSPRVDVTLTLAGSLLTIAVHDGDPRRPKPLRRPRRDGSGGWGLRLVTSLAAEAGGGMRVLGDAAGRGKTVSVRLPLG